ncbi:class I tRNA ligase family protein, partial [Patescibacteria group bacterium]|nr:class I tRNA ligase family protein [Patescibacteria group bacterium]
TLHQVLLETAKLIAPVMPFFAEEMYQNIKTKEMPESIHLYDWPSASRRSGKPNDKLEEKMDQVRNMVSLALAERAELGIKVRQPLLELRIKNYELRNDDELLEIIKEEVNIKKISFDKNLKKEVELNTKITKELRKEGEYREMVRNVSKIRKEMGLTPDDIVNIESTFDVMNIEEFKKEIGAKEFVVKKEITDKNAKEIKINKEKYYLLIKKLSF